MLALELTLSDIVYMNEIFLYFRFNLNRLKLIAIEVQSRQDLNLFKKL